MQQVSKRWDKGVWVLMGICFMMGRAFVGTVNPFGVAMMSAACRERKKYGWMGSMVLTGMFSATSGNHLLRYIFCIMAIMVAGRFYKEMDKGELPLWLTAVLCGVVSLISGLVGSLLFRNTWECLFVSLGEGVAVYGLGRVFRPGIRFILEKKWKDVPGNEEWISLLAIVFLGLYGVPQAVNDLFSLTRCAGYFLILFAGVSYGAAPAAMTGVAAGVLAVAQGGNPVLVGLYSGLGVISGAVRKGGKIISSLLYLTTGCLLIYGAGNLFPGVVELRSLVSGTLIFLGIPGVQPRKAEIFTLDDSAYVGDEVKELANQKLNDFSDAFRRLAKSFTGRVRQQESVPGEVMEDILEDISERLCQGCLNCRHCWERHGDETRQGMADILWQMEQQGEASVWQENQDFASRCMRLEEYKELARQEMAHARQRIGWQNQLARNREIMARQMLEVAQALSGFTTRLGDGQPLQRGVLNQLKKRLELYGIHIEKVWGVKKNNKIEVAFTGHCGKNQCLTKTDVAAVLSEELGAKVTPARETRNVLSRESQTMYFRQDTCYKGLTAVARVSRWDQQVSGDNYSFLELESGELLMVLADGMGYGGEAERDSGSLIETLEHLLEAGFEKQTAWRLLNTLLVAEYEGESFTTLDMVSVDLYTGWCQFIKSGAAAAYLYRDGQVEVIEAQSLPVGVSVDTGCDVVKRQLKPGDMVILVSDGVPDGYEKDMTEMIREVAGPNAQEFANQILIHALAGASQEAADDMTVLVLGFWNKN